MKLVFTIVFQMCMITGAFLILIKWKLPSSFLSFSNLFLGVGGGWGFTFNISIKAPAVFQDDSSPLFSSCTFHMRCHWLFKKFLSKVNLYSQRFHSSNDIELGWMTNNLLSYSLSYQIGNTPIKCTTLYKTNIYHVYLINPFNTSCYVCYCCICVLPY